MIGTTARTILAPALIASRPYVKKAHAEASLDKPSGTPNTAPQHPPLNPALIKNIQHTHQNAQSTPATHDSKPASSAPKIPIVAISAGTAGILSTAVFFPVIRTLTLSQKNNSSPITEAKALVPNVQSIPHAYKGGASMILTSFILRILQMEAHQTTAKHTEEKHPEWTALKKDLAAAAAASAVDSAVGGSAEISSMAKQLGKLIPNKMKAEMFVFVVLRDLVSNSIAFVLPKRIRSEFNITSNFLNNLGTSFIAMSVANIGTTVLDKMKTLRTTEGLPLKEALKSLTAKQLLSEYATRVFSIGGRMAAFLALNTTLLDILSKYTQQKEK
jgi:hypothetical protein